MHLHNYVGRKGGQTIAPQIFNVFPKADNYYSLFFGSGSFEFLPENKTLNWVVAEKNPRIRSQIPLHSSKVYSCYTSLLKSHAIGKNDCIFADPPYLFTCRKSGKRYYSYEFDMSAHEAFLSYMVPTKAKVVITHPKNSLYDTVLKNWHYRDLVYNSRQGVFVDGIYTNFNAEVVELNCYDYIGSNNTKRQQIKRKRHNLINKFDSLSFHEQCAVMQILSKKC